MENNKDYTNEKIIALIRWGCDCKGALERMLGDEKLYFNLLECVLKEPAFIELGKAISEGNAKLAFDKAHLIKGFSGNMGLTPIYNITVEIVERLRTGNLEGTDDNYKLLMEAYSRLADLCGD